MNEEQRRQKFYRDAAKLVKEFLANYDADDSSLAPFGSELYDRDALAKHHRAVWLNWARGQDDAPVGWLIDYQSQTEQHKEIQRMQAEEMFAMGYQAAMQDQQRKKETQPACDDVKDSRKSTIQAFGKTESRLMLAAVMKFLEHTMKKHNIVISKEIVDRLLRKLEILSDVKVEYVDYFVPNEKKATSNLKPKWKRDNPNNKAIAKKESKPVVGRRGLGSYMKGKT
jgi:hypothetical protein